MPSSVILVKNTLLGGHRPRVELANVIYSFIMLLNCLLNCIIVAIDLGYSQPWPGIFLFTVSQQSMQSRINVQSAE